MIAEKSHTLSSKYEEEGRQDVRSVAKFRQSWVCVSVS